MAENVVRQRLAAILAADVAGYSRLMGDDERATIDAINSCRAVFREQIEANGGRVVDMAGDSVLAIFDTAIGAFTTAMAAQERLGDLNADVAVERRMLWRIGVNTGDIHEQDDGTVYGDGVNVAARLEALAEPGGICLSDKVHTEVRGKIDRGFADLGDHEVKNIAEPVRAYRVLAAGEVAPAKPNRIRLLALAGTAAVVAIIVAFLWPGEYDDSSPDVVETATPDGALPPLPSGPSIAVLPFDNLGGDPEQEYFADGLTEDILTRLAAFSDLKVIARNSSFQYKGEAVDVRDVGRDLGAAFVLEGSVRRDATSIRISAQLLDAKDGAHVWQQTYDRDLSAGNIFAIQDEITEQVAAAIGGPAGAITASRIERMQGGVTDDLRSYECVLLAHEYARSMTAELHLSARECLVDVVAREPNNVEALANLGQIYIEEIWSGFNPRDAGPTSLEAAFEVLNRAVKLSPDHSLARKVLAVAFYSDGDAEQFQDEARKAIALNPNDINNVAEMAMWIGYSGDWEGSKALSERVRRLVGEAPNWHNWTEFNYHYRDKDYAAAATSARATLEIEHWASPWYLALAYAGMGETEKAMEALAKARTLDPNLDTETVREMVDYLFLDQTHIALLMDGHAQLLVLEESQATQRPVIAVLPFDNMSGDPEQEYFADGITEDIITRLSRFPDLKVIARNSSFQYKGEAVDVRDVGADLGATHVVEGSVRRAEGELRVTVQLLAVADGAHLWAESYDRNYDVGSIFDIQDEITGQIVSTIADTHGVLDRAALLTVQPARPESLDTYECILVARGYQGSANAEKAQQARLCLEAVTVSDSTYAEAWAWLAFMYNEHILYWSPEDATLTDRAQAAAHRAIELDPANQRAHLVNALLYFARRDCVHFSTEATDALAANPNHTETLMEVAWRTMSCGGWDQAADLMRKVLDLDQQALPYPHGLLSLDCYRRQEYECALSEAVQAEVPGFYYSYMELSLAYVGLGRLEDARAAPQKIIALNPEFAANAWAEMDYWWFAHPDFVDGAIADFRTAGLDIPPRPETAN
jgi:adenylate cyclase